MCSAWIVRGGSTEMMSERACDGWQSTAEKSWIRSWDCWGFVNEKRRFFFEIGVYSLEKIFYFKKKTTALLGKGGSLGKMVGSFGNSSFGNSPKNYSTGVVPYYTQCQGFDWQIVISQKIGNSKWARALRSEQHILKSSDEHHAGKQCSLIQVVCSLRIPAKISTEYSCRSLILSWHHHLHYSPPNLSPLSNCPRLRPTCGHW